MILSLIVPSGYRVRIVATEGSLVVSLEPPGLLG
jgi:hypothetical protein